MTDALISEERHDTETVASMLRTIGWTLLSLLGKLPLCRVGLHNWCACCSPMYCTRCAKRDPWT